MRRLGLGLLCAAMLGPAGCGDDDYGFERPAADASAGVDATTLPDLTKSKATDAASTSDLVMGDAGSHDLGPDMTVIPDLTSPADGAESLMPPTTALTGKQRRYLRGLGHHLEPVVHVGKEGLSEGLVEAAATALAQHELVKIRLGEAAGEDRHGTAAALAKAAAAELVQVLGRTLLLYRRHPEEPKINLP